MTTGVARGTTTLSSRASGASRGICTSRPALRSVARAGHAPVPGHAIRAEVRILRRPPTSLARDHQRPPAEAPLPHPEPADPLEQGQPPLEPPGTRHANNVI